MTFLLVPPGSTVSHRSLLEMFCCHMMEMIAAIKVTEQYWIRCIGHCDRDSVTPFQDLRRASLPSYYGFFFLSPELYLTSNDFYYTECLIISMFVVGGT